MVHYLYIFFIYNFNCDLIGDLFGDLIGEFMGDFMRN
jgi:hypothetical protein